MPRLNHPVFTLLLVACFAGCSPQGFDSTKSHTQANTLQERDGVIYGKDDRLQIEHAPVAIQDLARSTVAIFYKNALEDRGDHFFISNPKTFGERYNLCLEERFFNEVSKATCTGFLIGNNRIATAAHCVQTSSSKCEDFMVVFDHQNRKDPQSVRVMKKENVYACKKLVKLFRDPGKVDWAIFELDREPKGRAPLKYDIKTPIQPGQKIFVIGHPGGVPQKTSTGKVRAIKNGYLEAAIDAYVRNSGSPVFDQESNKVIGILTSGATDWEIDEKRSCKKSRVCEETGCGSGEKITLLNQLCDVGSEKCPEEFNANPNSCRFAYDGVCDDGRDEALFNVCARGTDEKDCQNPAVVCKTPDCKDRLKNSCKWANDGSCDDGRPGAKYNFCKPGTDENDCRSVMITPGQ